MQRKKKIIIPVVVLILVAAGVWRFWETEQQAPGPEIKIFGNIDIRQAGLAFPEQQRIIEVLVQEGDRVTAGQTLARQQSDRLEAQISQTKSQISAQQQVVNRLEAGTRRQEIEQARAEVVAARAQLDNAKTTYTRVQQTADAGVASQQALDNARSAFNVAQAQLQVKQKALNLALEGPRKEDIAAARDTLKSLEASLSLLNIRLADMTLRSPSVGVIQNRILEPGEMGGPTRPVVTLALTTPKWVRAYIPEPELDLINLGMPAKIMVDAYPDQPYDGWIGFISPVAEFTPKSVQTEDLRTKLVYEVRVFIRDPKDLLRLGTPATVLVERNAAPVKDAGVPPAGNDTTETKGQ